MGNRRHPTGQVPNEMQSFFTGEGHLKDLEDQAGMDFSDMEDGSAKPVHHYMIYLIIVVVMVAALLIGIFVFVSGEKERKEARQKEEAAAKALGIQPQDTAAEENTNEDLQDEMFKSLNGSEELTIEGMKPETKPAEPAAAPNPENAPAEPVKEAAAPAAAPEPQKPEPAQETPPAPKPEPKAAAPAPVETPKPEPKKAQQAPKPPKTAPKKPAKPAKKKAAAKAAPKAAAKPAAKKETPKVSNAAKAKEHYLAGNKLVMGRQFAQAVKEYREAIKLNPRLASAYRGLGVAYASLGNRDQAIKNYKKYLELAPNAPDAAQVRQIIGQ